MALILTSLALTSSALPAHKHPLETKSLTTTECVNNKWHTLSYKTVGPADNVMVDLDTVDHLEAVQCDLDGTKLQLKFTNEISAAEWFLKFHDWNDHFLVGGTRWNCTAKQAGHPGLIIRRTVDASQDGQYLNVRAANARYDEIYEDADISFKSEGSCDSSNVGKSQHVCVGFNSDCTGIAAQSLPIFQNQWVDLECSDCFVDFEMDVFIDVTIRDWEVQNLSAGFRNMAVNASTVLDAKAQANWNTGIDKVLPLLQNQYLVDFKVGVVPFMIFFDLPVEFKATFAFQSEAEAKIGVQANIGFGNAYVAWNPKTHWTHATPSVTMETNPVFATSASMNAVGTVSVVPSLTAHFDKILSYEVEATPLLQVEIQGSEASKNVCITSTYSLDVASQTTLDINIPWANIAKDWNWNKDIYNSGTKTLGQKCIPL